MHNQNLLQLNRKAILSLIISSLFAPSAFAAAGRVEFSIGNVSALSATGVKRDVAKGDEINKGDTLITDVGGRAQLRFTDGGYISLQPSSEFSVKDYNFNGKPDGTELGIFGLIKGGFRAITGAIGHTKRSAYRVDTPVATIGIRGTEYILIKEGEKWFVKVGDGSVYMQNEGGDLVLFKGQIGEASSLGVRPQYASDFPKVTARSPEFSGTVVGKEGADASIFTQAEQYTDDGISTAIASNNDLAGVLSIYAANNSVGIYNLDTSFAQTVTAGGSISNVSIAQISMSAFFGAPTPYAAASFKINYDFSGQSQQSAFVANNMPINLSAASFNITGANAITSGSDPCSVGGCTFTGTGLFAAPNATKGSINYNFFLPSGGAATGTAGFTGTVN